MDRRRGLCRRGVLVVDGDRVSDWPAAARTPSFNNEIETSELEQCCGVGEKGQCCWLFAVAASPPPPREVFARGRRRTPARRRLRRQPGTTSAPAGDNEKRVARIAGVGATCRDPS